MANTLLDRALAACVQILPGIESHYFWEGKRESSAEFLLLVKTRVSRYADLERCVKELHPYEVPEIISLPIDQAFQPYCDWVALNSKG